MTRVTSELALNFTAGAQIHQAEKFTGGPQTALTDKLQMTAH